MDYEAVWKVLSDLITEFRRRGETINLQVMSDLHSAKTLIHVWKADPAKSDCLSQIEVFLENVESTLMLAAYEKFGTPFAEEWMQKLKQAREITSPKREEAQRALMKPFPIVPKGAKWVRIQVSAETPEKTVKELAANYELRCETQKDGFIIVSGTEKELKAFLQKFAEYFRASKKRNAGC